MSRIAFVIRPMGETLQYREFNTLVRECASDLFIDFSYALKTFAIVGKILIYAGTYPIREHRTTAQPQSEGQALAVGYVQKLSPFGECELAQFLRPGIVEPK